MLSALSSRNYTEELINALGLDKNSIIQKTENYTGKSHRKETKNKEEANEPASNKEAKARFALINISN